MSPQDWEQMPFRSETLSNGFYSEPDRDCLKEEFQDLVILAQYTGCLISKIFPSCMKYLCPKLYQFKFS